MARLSRLLGSAVWRWRLDPSLHRCLCLGGQGGQGLLGARPWTSLNGEGYERGESGYERGRKWL